MKNKFILLVFLFTIVTFKVASAQMAGINFTLGFPQGEFNDNVQRTGFGGTLSFNFFEPTKKRPYTIGINLGYMNLGIESRQEHFSRTIPDVYVDVSRTNNIINSHMLFQIILPSGSIRPYVEALFGGSYLFTETKITSGNSDEEVASSTNMDDYAWSYGGGAGLLFRVSNTSNPMIGDIFVDFKVRYLYGTEAEYLTPGSVTISHGNAYYLVSKSKTDMITASMGAVITFNSLIGL